MQFNVSELLRESYGSFREFDIDEAVRVDGAPQRLTGRFRLDRVPQGIFVRTTLHGERAVECSRCLEPTVIPVDLRIEEQYVPTIDPHTGARISPPEGEEDAYRISERHMLDLTLPAQQYWMMALPIASVCSEDCAGLCSSCGARREDGHACAEPQPDERWASLRNLKLG
jgi:uncharacterized protein